MSLIIDNLKKLQKHADHSSVPPAMVAKPVRRRGVKRLTVLLAILLLAAAGAAALFLVDTGETSYKTAPPAVTDVQPANKTAPVKTAEPEAKHSTFLPEVPVKPEMPASGTVKHAGSVAVMKKLTAPKPPAELSKQEKPALSAKQRAEFQRKIKYNTMTATANKALSEKRYARAAEYYRKALSMKRSSANLTDLLLAEIGLGNSEAVRGELKRYSSSADDRAVAAAALEMSRAGYQAKALGLIDSYMGRFETDGRLYYARGQIFESSGDYNRAEFAYGKAVSMFPSDPYYAYAYARILDTEGSYKKASEEYGRVVQLSSGGEIAKNASARISVLKDYMSQKADVAKD